MSLATVHTRAQLGLQAPEVTVEVHLSNGLPAFTIVGLPETAVKESKDRVRSALLNSHFEFPQRRITVNLGPADLPKEGGRFDLPIAIGILAASQQIPSSALTDYEFSGELTLSGALRGIRGAIGACLAANKTGRQPVFPEENESELSLCGEQRCGLAENLLSVCAHLQGRAELQAPSPRPNRETVTAADLRDVKGQLAARRALEVAAAGGHNLLFFGPPGTGKSMLAERLPSILPELSDAEALECAGLASIARNGAAFNWGVRPYRSPHHTSSAVALVGGGSHPRPGEISLAHNGVLFLDELPEFSRHVLEVLREPLENGQVSISRAKTQVDFPADFQLIGAMNPCPCGYYGERSNRCECSPSAIQRYRTRISGPLLDRIDLHVSVSPLPAELLHDAQDGEASVDVKARVDSSRDRQHTRQGCANAALKGAALRRHCQLSQEVRHHLLSAIARLGLSARAHDRVLRVARTAADLDGAEDILVRHLNEALSYRQLDRRPIH